MVLQVHGKRFVYKFVCDLKQLLGYSAGELHRLVDESAHKELQKARDNIRPGRLFTLCTVSYLIITVMHGYCSV